MPSCPKRCLWVSDLSLSLFCANSALPWGISAHRSRPSSGHRVFTASDHCNPSSSPNSGLGHPHLSPEPMSVVQRRINPTTMGIAHRSNLVFARGSPPPRRMPVSVWFSPPRPRHSACRVLPNLSGYPDQPPRSRSPGLPRLRRLRRRVHGGRRLWLTEGD
jgi:hypothetical protein